MTKPASSRATSWDRTGAFRQRMITVLALEDEFSGALAYALQRALHEPAAVRAVRVPQTTHPARFHSPIPVGTLEGDDPAALTKLSSQSDLMVVQRPSGSGDPAVARIMAELERDTQCLLVEVDDEGDINRVSGPDGWFYAAADHPRGLGSGDRVTTGTARQPVSGRH